MKKLIFLVLLVMTVFNSSCLILADENVNIRVGLEYSFKDVSSIPINNNKIIIGFEQNSVFTKYGTVSGNNLLSKVTYPYYLAANVNFSNYESALNFALDFKDNKFNAVPALNEQKVWNVYFGGFNSQEEAKVAKDSLAEVTSIVSSGKNSVSIYNGANEAVIIDVNELRPQISADNNDNIKLSGRSFRGYIELYRTNSLLTGINVLSMDDYLCSVVPSEMPSSWPIEALKAQAVACRNYATAKSNNHYLTGYDVCDSTHCQVYKGIDSENENSSKAVRATSGILAYYNGEIINAVFSSSSGGYTADAESVWGTDIGYLKAVPDTNETGGKQWTRTFTLDEISSILTKKGYNIGNAKNIYIGNTAVSGRVNSLVIEGTTGNVTLEKEEIRTFFAPSDGGSLESRNFKMGNGNNTVSENFSISVNSNNGNIVLKISSAYAVGNNKTVVSLGNGAVVAGKDGTYTYSSGTVSGTNANDIAFIGKGWGHGVGMSQFGAKGMAEAGYTYDKILKHYYTGIELH